MNAPAVIVTDHALIRWLERVHNIDMEFFRAELQRFIQPYAALGATRFDKGDLSYHMENGYLKTVTPRRTLRKTRGKR